MGTEPSAGARLGTAAGEYEYLGLCRSPKEQNVAAAIWAHHLQGKVLRCVALPIKWQTKAGNLACWCKSLTETDIFCWKSLLRMHKVATAKFQCWLIELMQLRRGEWSNVRQLNDNKLVWGRNEICSAGETKSGLHLCVQLYATLPAYLRPWAAHYVQTEEFRAICSLLILHHCSLPVAVSVSEQHWQP